MTGDLVVRGGIVVDGTGLSQRRRDVAGANNRIEAVGCVPGVKGAHRTFDVDGLEPVALDDGLQTAMLGKLVRPAGTEGRA